jgi:tRNA(Arg) A34 adenosine deaminase TadA
VKRQFDYLDHIKFLRLAIETSRKARELGNTPFGAILVGPKGDVLLEQGNVEISERRCTGHAELVLVERASGIYDKDFLWQCTLYTSVEPCAMCTGAIYWSNVGAIVYALSERQLLTLTRDHPQNPTLDLPCREVIARGQKDICIIGPFEELEEEVTEVHKGYWEQ